MTAKILLIGLFSTSLCLLPTGHALADSAEVLPKGISKVDATFNYFIPIDERFDDSGKTEDVAANYNVTLDSSVFGAVPPGWNLGQSIVSFEYDIKRVFLSYQYGLTDKLSVGITIPYWWVKNDVNAVVDSSSATLGINGAPMGWGGVAATTEDIISLLSSAYGLKRFETWSNDGIGDITVGGRYQYLNTDKWRLAITAGAQLPTGYADDPDSLVDYGWSDEANILLLQLNNDYTGIKDLVLNATFRYGYSFPFHKTERVLEDVNLPITNTRDNVERDPGDVFEGEASASYALGGGFGCSLLYKYGYKAKDTVTGTLPISYKPLEDETDYEEHVVVTGLSYSTLSLFQEKKFPIPLNASVSYRNRFDGRNMYRSEFIGMSLSVFF